MDVYSLPYNLRDAVLCLSFLAGIGASIFILTRKHKNAGILTLIGFALLGVDPIAEIVIFRVLYPATDYGSAMMTVLDWAYFCISGLTIILGVAALLAGIFSALRPKQLDTPSPEQTVKPES